MSNSKTTSEALNSRGRRTKRSTMDMMMRSEQKPDLISGMTRSDKKPDLKPDLNSGMTRSDEKPDMINMLPDNVLSYILSFVRIDEAVRSGVLSRRWENLWRETSRVEFDGKKMIKPLTQLLHSREPRTISDLNLDASMREGVYMYGLWVYLILLRHSGDISSCRFVHFRTSLAIGEVETWVGFLHKNKKRVKDQSLECEPDYGEIAEYFVSKDDFYKPLFPHRIFSSLGSLELINYTIDCWKAFVGCNNLKNLKLKRIYLDEVILRGILENCVILENFSLHESIGFIKLIIKNQNLKVLQLQALSLDEIKISCQNLEDLLLDSIICPAKSVSIYSPKLRAFRSYCYSTYGRMFSVKEGKSIAKTHEILAHCIDFLEHSKCNIFQSLSTLSMDLDLNHMREVMNLSFVLRSCTCLQSLKISLPKVFEHQNLGSFNDSALPYPMSMFWERRELCYCIQQKLNFVCIRGFKGKEQEVEFVKYLIAGATVMERITIICNGFLEEAKSLLSLPRASNNLSINIKGNINNTADEFAQH